MAEVLRIHPVTPQERLLRQAVDIIRQGGVIAYPTDSSYALGFGMGDKSALDRVRQIRQTSHDHEFTLVCSDLSELATYARVENWAYRLLKSLTPGPYTFILKATRDVPKRLQVAKRRTIGIRVPEDRIAQQLVRENGEPLMSSTLLMPGDELPMTDPDEIRDRLDTQIEAVVDGGMRGIEPTTVLDLTGDSVSVIRRGKGDLRGLE